MEYIRLNRRFTGIELKREYFQMAAKNCELAEMEKGRQLNLFDRKNQ